MLGKNGIEGFMKMMVQKMIMASASAPPQKKKIKVGIEHCAVGQPMIIHFALNRLLHQNWGFNLAYMDQVPYFYFLASMVV